MMDDGIICSQHVIVVASEPEAKELNDDITDNDGGGGMIKSE